MIPWGKPKTLPSGAHDYLLSGNPGKAELYTLSFQLPANYKIRPFLLAEQCYITVISGQLYVGEGDIFKKSNKHVLSAGSFIMIPADTHLFFWTNEKAILQLHGIGPLDVKYINPLDDPRSKKK
jgi:hypothetical protein